MQPYKTIPLQTSTSRDLVLTLMHGGDFDYIAPFILSLKKSGFRGSTVVFTSNVDHNSIEQLRNCGAIVIGFRFFGAGRQHLCRPWPLWRWFFSTRAPRSAKTWLAHAVFHLYYRRHLLYSKFLEQHAADFDRVLLTDSKDVFFQADPFAWSWTDAVHFFLEDASNRMGGCPVHQEWFRRLFGPSFVVPHARAIPACAGTTFGDMAGIRQYLDLMVATTMRARELGKLWGGDQGVHNYILIQNLMSNIIVHENGRGPVLTMKLMKESALQLDAQGTVLNDDGVPVPVLHQYEYFPALKERLMSSLQIAGRTAVRDIVRPAVPPGNSSGLVTSDEPHPSPA